MATLEGGHVLLRGSMEVVPLRAASCCRDCTGEKGLGGGGHAGPACPALRGVVRTVNWEWGTWQGCVRDSERVLQAVG